MCVSSSDLGWLLGGCARVGVPPGTQSSIATAHNSLPGSSLCPVLFSVYLGYPGDDFPSFAPWPVSICSHHSTAYSVWTGLVCGCSAVSRSQQRYWPTLLSGWTYHACSCPTQTAHLCSGGKGPVFSTMHTSLSTEPLLSFSSLQASEFIS